VWIVNPSWVFYCGAGFALCSLGLSFLIPNNPSKGNEFTYQTKEA